MSPILLYLLAFANIISMVHLGLYMVGANIYDIKQIRTKARTLVAPVLSATSKKQPLVSIIIPAHNEELVIRRTLDSVRASTYRNMEIIVVDDGSKDRTGDEVRTYMQRIPKTRLEARTQTRTHVPARRASVSPRRAQFMDTARRIHERHIVRTPITNARIVYVYQKNLGKAAAMNNGIANYAQGEFVMCLDADSVLHPAAVERAVAYFADPKIIGVAANVRIMQSRSVLGMVQRLEHMIGYRSKKFYSLTNSEFIIGGVASTYRREALESVQLYDTDTMTEDIGLSLKLVAKKGNRDARIVYAADVVAMTEGVQNFKQLLRQRYRWKMGCLQNIFKYRHLIFNTETQKYNRMLTRYRLPMAILSEFLLILEPLLLGYIVYMSFHWHTLNILIGGYITVTLYVLWTIWPDEHLTTKEKLRLSRWAVAIYGLFYIMDIVQLAAVFRCLKEYRSIAKRDNDTTWVSPVRAGQPLGARA